jgi:HlyD family secretion protein
VATNEALSLPESSRADSAQQSTDSAAPNIAASLAARRRRRRWAMGIGAVVILAGLAVAWRLLRAEAPVHFVTATVTRGDITKAVTASGTVNPQTTVQVGSYVSGSIQEVLCDFNTRVKKGQLCARIDPRPYQSTVDQDRANVQAAQAQLEKDQSNLTLQQGNYNRSKALFDQQLLSQDQDDAAKAAYDQAVAQVQVDQAAVTQRTATLKSSEVNLGYTDIVSPVDGTVVSRNVTVGQTVAASFQTPTLFLIATDLTKMQVDASVSEGDIGGIKEGAAASFTVEAFAGKRFDGAVTQVRQAPEAVQNVVTYDVVITVDNPDLLLKPGMTANVRIVVDKRQNVLRVPDQALRYSPGGVAAAEPGTSAPRLPGLFGIGRVGGGRGGGGGGRGQARGGGRGGERGAAAAEDGTNAAHVYVLRNGQPVQIAITTGLDDDNWTEVVSGDLKEGDEVIVSESSGTKPTAPPS